jgi:hypothetical protein
MTVFSLFKLFAASISATVGRSMVEMEFVIAVGKRMQGSAIPVRTPYVDSASAFAKPYFCRKIGMEMASTLWKMLITRRFVVSGTAMCKRSLKSVVWVRLNVRAKAECFLA